MLRFVLAALLAGGVAPAQSPAEIARSTAELGSANFRTRESAGEKLRNIGAPALQPLQDSLIAGNPEANRRAEALMAQIRLRLSDEAAIAPKIVSVRMFDAKLADIFEELRKQTTYEFRILGETGLLAKEFAFDTGGKVPMWAALAKLCEIAGLQIEGASGQVGPRNLASRTELPATTGTITLAVRGAFKPWPSTATRGIRMEVLPVSHPSAYSVDQIPVRVKFVPEPGIAWVAVNEIVATKALDSRGFELNHDHTFFPTLALAQASRRKIIKTESGSMPRGMDAVSFHEGGFCLVAPRERSVKTAVLLEGVIHASVWGAAEDILKVTGFAEEGDAIPDSNNDCYLGAKLVANPANKHAPYLDVEFGYNMAKVRPTTTGSEEQDIFWLGRGAKGEAIRIKPADAPVPQRLRNPEGLSLSDAAGRAFVLNMNSSQTSQHIDPGRTAIHVRAKYRYTFRHAGMEPNGPPATLAFHGARMKDVTFPFALKDVPLTQGTATEALEIRTKW